jgi:para-aminobenzoate synthetase / 4-amino-4-deoxychorismate lyase
VLQVAQQQSEAGRWVVVVLSYEAAPSFDSAFVAKESKGFPLAWLAVFEKQSPGANQPVTRTYRTSQWQPSMTASQYSQVVHEVKEYIARGETYQVNLTFPLWCEFSGDSWAWYRDLAQARKPHTVRILIWKIIKYFHYLRNFFSSAVATD